MYEIAKEFGLSASHILTKVPPGHPCGRLHGHNYVLEFVLRSGSLDARGFVVDYRDLDGVKRWIDEHLDHRNLNEAVAAPEAFGIAFEPTAEMLARFLYEKWVVLFPQLVAVRVRETPRTVAEYRP